MKRGNFTVLICLLMCAAVWPASQLSAQNSGQERLDSMEAVGKIGPYRIGLNYTVRRKTELVAAHYFYASQGKNIPLVGTSGNQSVHLHGADGSDFYLRFVGNGSNCEEPLTFYNSVGLRGTWSLGHHKLPAVLTLSHGTENPGQRLYSQVTAQSDSAFEAMVSAAKEAILSGDPAATSKYVHFPLMSKNSRRSLVIRDASELRAHWSTIFPAAFLAKLRLDITHEMFVHEGEAMLGDGELWFDEKGLIAINPVFEPKRAM